MRELSWAAAVPQGLAQCTFTVIARSTLPLFLEAFSSRPRNSKHCCRLVGDGRVFVGHVSSKEEKMFLMRTSGTSKTRCFPLSFRHFKCDLYNSNIVFDDFLLSLYFYWAH